MQNEVEKTETTTQVQAEKKLTIDEIVDKIVFEQKSILLKEKINKAKEDKKYCDIFVIKNKKNENYYNIFLEIGSAIELARTIEVKSNNHKADLSDSKLEEYSIINDYIYDVYRVYIVKGKLVLKKTTENEPIRSL